MFIFKNEATENASFWPAASASLSSNAVCGHIAGAEAERRKVWSCWGLQWRRWRICTRLGAHLSLSFPFPSLFAILGKIEAPAMFLVRTTIFLMLYIYIYIIVCI